jgi:hypothetical protein
VIASLGHASTPNVHVHQTGRQAASRASQRRPERHSQPACSRPGAAMRR